MNTAAGYSCLQCLNSATKNLVTVYLPDNLPHSALQTVLDQILEMDDYCSKHCNHFRKSKYARLQYRLRNTNYVLLEVEDLNNLPKVISRNSLHNSRFSATSPVNTHNPSDETDSGISSVKINKYKNVSTKLKVPQKVPETEIIDKLIQKLDQLNLNIEIATTKPKKIYTSNKSPNLSSASDEITNTQDILGKNILDRIKEMEAKIAAVL